MIVLDRTAESELRYCDEARLKEKSAGQTPAARSKGVRRRLANFVIWVGGAAIVLLAATLALLPWGSPFNAIAAGFAALILQSAISAAGQIAGSSESARQ